MTGNKVKEKNVWNANLLREQAKNNVICNDILCEDMNNFFATIGENLHAKFPNQEPLWKGSSCIHSFSLQLLTQDEILYHLNNLPDKSQTDILDMDCKLLRMARHIISIHLCHFYNLSIQVDRPIFVVSFIGKILEKCVHKQLMYYLKAHDLITPDQSA